MEQWRAIYSRHGWRHHQWTLDSIIISQGMTSSCSNWFILIGKVFYCDWGGLLGKQKREEEDGESSGAIASQIQTLHWRHYSQWLHFFLVIPLVHKFTSQLHSCIPLGPTTWLWWCSTLAVFRAVFRSLSVVRGCLMAPQTTTVIITLIIIMWGVWLWRQGDDDWLTTNGEKSMRETSVHLHHFHWLHFCSTSSSSPSLHWGKF